MSSVTFTPPPRPTTRAPSVRAPRVLRENGLSIVLLLLFVSMWAGQTLTGWRSYNHQQADHGEQAVTLGRYVRTGHFVEATAENWESEFLQMAAFVWLSVHLRQRGSSQSKGLGGDEDVDREPDPTRPGAPWPVRRGGVWLALYAHSLTCVFLLLFVASFLLHAAGGAREHAQDELAHGRPGVTMLRFMTTSEFWFQSLQNWQSEFLAIGAMVLLSVWLRQRGSPESKPVDAAHDENG